MKRPECLISDTVLSSCGISPVGNMRTLTCNAMDLRRYMMFLVRYNILPIMLLTFLTRDGPALIGSMMFLTGNVAFLVWNGPFLVRDAAFLVRNRASLTGGVRFLTRNVPSLTVDGVLLIRSVAFLIRDATFLVSGTTIPVKDKALWMRRTLPSLESADVSAHWAAAPITPIGAIQARASAHNQPTSEPSRNGKPFRSFYW
jgi:hypothetical protein